MRASQKYRTEVRKVVTGTRDSRPREPYHRQACRDGSDHERENRGHSHQPDRPRECARQHRRDGRRIKSQGRSEVKPNHLSEILPVLEEKGIVLDSERLRERSVLALCRRGRFMLPPAAQAESIPVVAPSAAARTTSRDRGATLGGVRGPLGHTSIGIADAVLDVVAQTIP